MPVKSPDVTLTGTMTDDAGNLVSGTLTFTLNGFGTSVPSIAGVQMLPGLTFTTSVTNGVFSTTFYSNQIITPGPLVTFYNISFQQAPGSVGQIFNFSQNYQFSPGIYDLSNLVPLGNTIPNRASSTQAIPNVFSAQPGTFITGLTASSNFTSINTGVVYVGPSPGEFPTLATAYAGLGAAGGTVVVPSGYTETLTSNFVFNKSGAGFQFNGSATIIMGSFQFIFPDTLHGAFIEGPSMWGNGGNVPQTVFRYTGSSAAFQMGTPGFATDALNRIILKGIGIDISGAGINAIGIDTYGLGFHRFQEILVFSSGLANNQIGQRMQANAFNDGEGGVEFNNDYSGINIGVQINATNGGKVWTRVGVQGSTGSPTGFDLINVSSMNMQNVGVSNASSIGFRFTGATNNHIIGSSDASILATFDSGSNTNTLIALDSPGTVTNNGTNNVVMQPGYQLYSGSSGITALNEQGATGTLTGNSSDQTVYTYTMPANTLPAGKGIRISAWFNHPSGSASVTYKVAFGATLYLNNASTLAGTFFLSILIFNNAGVVNAQHGSSMNNVNNVNTIGSTGTMTSFSPLTSSINTTSPVVITLTFNVAATDTVRGDEFIVELIQ